jgi:hypothetical protein
VKVTPENYIKPKLRMRNGKWVCGIAEADSMAASSITIAYKAWKDVSEPKIRSAGWAYVTMARHKQRPKWVRNLMNRIIYD